MGWGGSLLSTGALTRLALKKKTSFHMKDFNARYHFVKYLLWAMLGSKEAEGSTVPNTSQQVVRKAPVTAGEQTFIFLWMKVKLEDRVNYEDRWF